VKGILHEDDARRTVEIGVDGIIVSNHGGRQLDGALSPLDALPAIVDAVGLNTMVMLDGGVRRGSDILKALVLGAKFVFVGRPFLYAASVGGIDGVLLAADILKSELHRNMALLGASSLNEISEHCLYTIQC
jgi:L-lactate dehydrogenase (cytochrome)